MDGHVFLILEKIEERELYSREQQKIKSRLMIGLWNEYVISFTNKKITNKIITYFAIFVMNKWNTLLFFNHKVEFVGLEQVFKEKKY